MEGLSPMEGGDSDGQEGKGFELANSGEQTAGMGGRTGARDQFVECPREGVGVGELRMLGMKEGKWFEVAEVSVRGNTGRTMDCGRKGIGRGCAGSSFTERFTEEDEVIRTDGDIRRWVRGRWGTRRGKLTFGRWLAGRKAGTNVRWEGGGGEGERPPKRESGGGGSTARGAWLPEPMPLLAHAARVRGLGRCIISAP